jgi:signal transduction histidine kinase
MAVAQSPSPAQAENLVKHAVAYAKQNTMAKLIEQTNQADGRFHVGLGSQLYIFIYDQNGVCKGIGFNTLATVGANRMEWKDPDGKLVFHEMVKVVKAKGSGWVDYKYLDPISKKVEQKTSYVELVEGMIVGAGIYK